LLSPVGIKVKAPGEPTLDPMKRFQGKKAAPPRIFKQVGQYAWKKKISPFAMGRKMGKKLTLKIMDK
jgi:hypothetical protein